MHLFSSLHHHPHKTSILIITMPGEWAWWVASSAETLHDWQYPPTPTHDLLIIIIIIIRDAHLKNKNNISRNFSSSPLRPSPTSRIFPDFAVKIPALKSISIQKVMYDMKEKLKAPNIMILFLIISMKGNIPSVAPMASCLDSAQSQEPMRRLHTYCHRHRHRHHHQHQHHHHHHHHSHHRLEKQVLQLQSFTWNTSHNY